VGKFVCEPPPTLTASDYMNIFDEVIKLKLPIGKYVVVGSGILIALNLKEGNDVDIVVTKDIFEEHMKNGWEQIPWTYLDHSNGIFLRKGLVELYLDVNCGKFNPSTSELIQRAKIINGIAFTNLSDTLNFKKEYAKNNPKHIKDIKLLEEYILNSVI